MRPQRLDALKEDNDAMEEIGFLYVFLLSILLLSSIFFTIEDSTRTRRKSTTATFYEDAAHHIAGVVQDVIDMRLSYPEVEYTRYFNLRHTDPDVAYRYRIEFSKTRVTLISRVGGIRVSAGLYNPEGIKIDEKIESDARAIRIQYNLPLDEIVISVPKTKL